MWYIIVALFIWASSFTVGKYAYQMFDPALTVQLRLIVAAILALPLFLSKYQTIEPAVRKKMWGLSFLLFPIGIFVQFMGLAYTSASSAVTIIGTEPIVVLLLGFLFFQKRVAWYDWLLSVVVFLGIALLVYGSKSDGAVNPFGLFLVFVAGLGFALSIHLGQAAMQKIPATLYTSTVLVQGAILCLPFTLLLTQNWHINFSWLGVLSVLYLGVCCSWLAYKLWNKGLEQTPTHISGMLIALEPVFGVLIAMLVLGERMTFFTAMGSVMVIGAAMLSTMIPIWRERRQNRV